MSISLEDHMKDPTLVNAFGLSRKHIFEAVEASLKRLDLDYILYLIHRFDQVMLLSLFVSRCMSVSYTHTIALDVMLISSSLLALFH